MDIERCCRWDWRVLEGWWCPPPPLLLWCRDLNSPPPSRFCSCWYLMSENNLSCICLCSSCVTLLRNKHYPPDAGRDQLLLLLLMLLLLLLLLWKPGVQHHLVVGRQRSWKQYLYMTKKYNVISTFWFIVILMGGVMLRKKTISADGELWVQLSSHLISGMTTFRACDVTTAR